MVFTKEDKVVIKVLRQEKGFGAKRLLKEFSNKNWSVNSLKKLLQEIDRTGSVDRKPGTGKTLLKICTLHVTSSEHLAQKLSSS
jgi:hypothetical protein